MTKTSVRTTYSSPVKKETTDSLLKAQRDLITRPMEQELALIKQAAYAAAESVALHGKPGPIAIGVASEDTFIRLTNELSGSIRLEWQELEGKRAMGVIKYHGDPSEVHAVGSGYLLSAAAQGGLSQGIIVGGGTAETIVSWLPRSSNDRIGPVTSRWGKEPDACWRGKQPSPAQTVWPTTVAEVVFANESASEMLAILNKWSLTGRNVIGVRVMRPAAATTAAEIRRQVSIVLVAQGAAELTTRNVWRLGPDAHRIQLGEGIERSGSNMVLPATWFAMEAEARQKIVFSAELMRERIAGSHSSISTSATDMAEHISRMRELNYAVGREIYRDTTIDSEIRDILRSSYHTLAGRPRRSARRSSDR